MAAAEAACRDPRNHRYTPTAGLPELREAIAAKTAARLRLRGGRGQVLVTNGGKQAVANAFAVLCDPGDEVLVPAPYWTTYPESIALAGGVPVVVPTDASSGFRVTVGQLEAARTPRTKVLLFVSPSNPTGAVYPKRGDRGASVGGPPSTGSGWSPTRSTSTWSTAAPSTTPCRWWSPSSPTAASWSTGWPRPTP